MSHPIHAIAPQPNAAAPLGDREKFATAFAAISARGDHSGGSDPNEKIAARVEEVRRIVRDKSGLDLSGPEIVQVHLLSIEPTSLAKSIVFSLTGNVLDLAEDGDDEHEATTPGEREPRSGER